MGAGEFFATGCFVAAEPVAKPGFASLAVEGHCYCYSSEVVLSMGSSDLVSSSVGYKPLYLRVSSMRG